MSQNPFSALKKTLVQILLEQMQVSILRKRYDETPDNPDEEVAPDVERMLNIPYINRNEVPLAMDIFKPKDSGDRDLPVIVTIHGGGLVMGDRKVSRKFSEYLASKGYLVFSIEYRLVPRANVCEELDDICAGMDIIGRKLVEFNVDYTRIFLAAESAGAYLALYVAAMKKSKSLQKAIGYEPSRMRFKAIGLISGMLYTNKNDLIGALLAEQFYGDKLDDRSFMRYMNPEDPEIIGNIPPVFLITSRGDFLNRYTIEYNRALKNAGVASKMLYYGDKKLEHAFVTAHPEYSESEDAINKMTAWFETQAARINKKENKALDKKLSARIEDGSVINQKSWKFIKDMNSSTDEKLDSTAIISQDRRYTYRQLFRAWERYAEVFTALDITEQNNSRAGVIGSITTETVFALFGLNMTGASVSGVSLLTYFNAEDLKKTVKEEKITDLIITDFIVNPVYISNILKEKDDLGLRNIIILHSRVRGTLENQSTIAYVKWNYQQLKKIDALSFMDDLLVLHEATPIKYAKKPICESAFILHTSGTTKGVSKPVPLSDKAINSAAFSCMRSDLFKLFTGKVISSPDMDASASYCMVDEMFVPLACNGTLVTMSYGLLSNNFNYNKKYGVNVIYSGAYLLPRFLNDASIDLSSVKVFFCGGSYLSPETKKQFNEVIAKRGGTVKVTNGYGLSEVGGACIVSDPENEDDVIGHPMPGINVKIYDEDTKTYYSLDDGPHTGVLYINSDSVSGGKIDDKVYFELTDIDGVPYLCTYDMVKVNDDKSLTYVGRSNQYFVNNEGVRFDAGLVQTSISAQPEILECALAPEYDKLIHDSVPVLYVKTSKSGIGAISAVRQALINVFIKDNLISESNLPLKCVIMDKIPYNQNGKVDIYKISKGEVKGTSYIVTPLRINKKLTDVTLVIAPADGQFIVLPEELDTEFNNNILKNMFGGGNKNTAQQSPFAYTMNQQSANTQNPGFVPPFVPPYMNMQNQQNANQDGNTNTQNPGFVPPFAYTMNQQQNANQNGDANTQNPGFVPPFVPPYMNMQNQQNANQDGNTNTQNPGFVPPFAYTMNQQNANQDGNTNTQNPGFVPPYMMPNQQNANQNGNANTQNPGFVPPFAYTMNQQNANQNGNANTQNPGFVPPYINTQNQQNTNQSGANNNSNDNNNSSMGKIIDILGLFFNRSNTDYDYDD